MDVSIYLFCYVTVEMKEGHLNADLCSTIENKYISTSDCICNKNSNEHSYLTHLQFETVHSRLVLLLN